MKTQNQIKELTTEEKIQKIHEIVFRIMCDIDDFCRENNICYFLSGGTCIGAVRHKGFIPWDDDADLMMPREDYERFLELFHRTQKGKYQVGSLKTDPDWQRPFARICDLHSRLVPKFFQEEPMGIFIDIFPIDGLPGGSFGQKIHYRVMRALNILRTSSVRTEFIEDEGHRLVKRFAKMIAQKKGPRYYAEKLDRRASKYKFNESEQVAAILALHYWDRETISRSAFEKAEYLPFEGKLFPVPAGYDQYLKNLYGDYMKPPKDGTAALSTHLDRWEIEFDINE